MPGARPPFRCDVLRCARPGDAPHLLRQWLAAKPEQQHWLVASDALSARDDPDMPDAEPASHATLPLIVPPGCLCCGAGLAFQVQLTRALRTQWPDYVLLDLSAALHPEQALAVLDDPWIRPHLADRVQLGHVRVADLGTSASQHPHWWQAWAAAEIWLVEWPPTVEPAQRMLWEQTRAALLATPVHAADGAVGAGRATLASTSGRFDWAAVQALARPGPG